MKIMLLDPSMHPRVGKVLGRIAPPLNIYLLAGMLRNNGYDVQVCDPGEMIQYYNNGWDKEKIEELLSDINVIGISVNSITWGLAKEFIHLVKRKEGAPFIVCGGIHPSFFAEYILEVTDADMVIRGDGETALLRLVQALEKNKSFDEIPNCTYRLKNRIISNQMIQSKELVNFGIPAYDLIPENAYYNLPMETSRGCPFNCTFCSSFYKKGWRSFDALSVVKRIESSLKFLGHRVKAKSILFTDELFTGDTERAVQIFELLGEQDADFKIHFAARITDFLKHENLMEKAAFIDKKISTIQMGIECGYDDGLINIRKGFRTKDVIKGLSQLKEKGLSKKAYLSFIIGFPWETYSDCIKTIEFALDIEDTFDSAILVNWWLPLKSPLVDIQAADGSVLNKSMYDNPLWVYDDNIFQATHPNLSLGDIEKISRQFEGVVKNMLDNA